MPALLQLPTEILDQIIDDTVPESVEAFSQSCTRIRRLAKDRLGQHYDDVRSYCGIELTNRESSGRGKYNSLELLEDMLQKPYLVRYPQKLTFGMIDMNSSYTPAPSVEFRAQVVNALIGCCYVPSDEIEEWAAAICSGHLGAGTALLLALLPNLRYLVIHGLSFRESHLKRMLYYIAGVSHDPRFDGRHVALSRVVKLHGSGSGYAGGGHEMEILAQLSALPSVKILRCRELMCPYGIITGWRRRSRRTHYGGVTKLEILGGRVNPNAVNHLLENIRDLTHFTCHVPARDLLSWGSVSIWQVLRHHTRHSLEELDLTWSENQDGNPQASFGDLGEFQVLRKLRVRYASIKLASEKRIVTPAPLAFMLPPSLKELRLVEDFCSTPKDLKWDLDQLVKLFDWLAESKPVRLPNLEMIDCEGAYSKDYEQSGMCQYIRETCMKAGVALKGLNSEESRTPLESCPQQDKPPTNTSQQQAGWLGSRYHRQLRIGPTTLEI